MIYFLLSAASGEKPDAVKIGFSTNVGARWYTLERQHGELKLLGVMSGSITLERYLHRQFVALNIPNEGQGREWFRPEPNLKRFIRRYAMPYQGVKCAPSGSDLVSIVVSRRTACLLGMLRAILPTGDNRTFLSMDEVIAHLISKAYPEDIALFEMTAPALPQEQEAS